jgi:hypothetical protein
VGVGLLALTASGMPAALADDEPVDDTAGPEVVQDEVGQSQREVLDGEVAAGEEQVAPAAAIEGFFGEGKSVGFTIGYDSETVPAGLDLSGVTYTLTASGSDRGSCTTDRSGWCDVSAEIDPMGMFDENASLTDDLLTPGYYAVRQTGAPTGLVPVVRTSADQVHLCGFFEGCDDSGSVTVGHDSLFSSPVVAQVVDEATEQPIEGAVYTLTGPADLITPLDDSSGEGSGEGSDEGSDELTELAQARVAVTEDDLGDPLLETVEATSTEDGTLSFAGWFLPSTEYVLSPVGSVAGYQADEASIAVELAGPSGGTRGAVIGQRLLVPVPSVVETPATPPTETVTPPVTPPVTPAPSPSPSPSPAASPSASVPSAAGAAGSRSAASVGRAVDPAPVDASASPVAAPSSSSSAAATTNRSGPPAPAVAPLADEPELKTVGSSLPDMSVIGFGLAFLLLVMAGLGYLVRRRARSNG